MKVIQRKAFFAHQGAVVLGILADGDDELRKVAVNKVHYKHFVAHALG